MQWVILRAEELGRHAQVTGMEKDKTRLAGADEPFVLSVWELLWIAFRFQKTSQHIGL